MSTPKDQKEVARKFSSWVSTYGWVTIRRIFDNMQIDIDYETASASFEDKESIYYQLLRVPFSNIFNGLIINQVEGYKSFIQKVFIDYLLSGSGNEKNAPVQGESTREALEEERNKFMDIADAFDVEVFNQNTLIYDSQKALLKIVKEKFKKVDEATEEDKQELIQLVDEFEAKSKQLNTVFCDFRSQFQQMIIVIQEYIENLPNYTADSDKLSEHRSTIEFDTNIGQLHK